MDATMCRWMCGSSVSYILSNVERNHIYATTLANDYLTHLISTFIKCVKIVGALSSSPESKRYNAYINFYGSSKSSYSSFSYGSPNESILFNFNSFEVLCNMLVCDQGTRKHQDAI